MTSKFAAIKIARRSISVAVFSSQTLEYTETRHLSNLESAAKVTADGFLREVNENYNIDSAAIEIPDNILNNRVAHLTQAVVKILRESGVPFSEVSLADLLIAYGVPPIKTRKELQRIALSIWPVLRGPRYSTVVLDAALLGLYTQVERLLSV